MADQRRHSSKKHYRSKSKKRKLGAHVSCSNGYSSHHEGSVASSSSNSHLGESGQIVGNEAQASGSNGAGSRWGDIAGEGQVALGSSASRSELSDLYKGHPKNDGALDLLIKKLKVVRKGPVLVEGGENNALIPCRSQVEWNRFCDAIRQSRRGLVYVDFSAFKFTGDYGQDESLVAEAKLHLLSALNNARASIVFVNLEGFINDSFDAPPVDVEGIKRRLVTSLSVPAGSEEDGSQAKQLFEKFLIGVHDNAAVFKNFIRCSEVSNYFVNYQENLNLLLILLENHKGLKLLEDAVSFMVEGHREGRFSDDDIVLALTKCGGQGDAPIHYLFSRYDLTRIEALLRPLFECLPDDGLREKIIQAKNSVDANIWHCAIQGGNAGALIGSVRKYKGRAGNTKISFFSGWSNSTIESSDKLGRNLLHLIAESGNSDAATAWFDKNFPYESLINAKSGSKVDRAGYTPLELALRSGAKEIVHEFVRHGAEITLDAMFFLSYAELETQQQLIPALLVGSGLEIDDNFQPQTLDEFCELLKNDEKRNQDVDHLKTLYKFAYFSRYRGKLKLPSSAPGGDSIDGLKIEWLSAQVEFLKKERKGLQNIVAAQAAELNKAKKDPTWRSRFSFPFRRSSKVDVSALAVDQGRQARIDELEKENLCLREACKSLRQEVDRQKELLEQQGEQIKKQGLHVQKLSEDLGKSIEQNVRSTENLTVIHGQFEKMKEEQSALYGEKNKAKKELEATSSKLDGRMEQLKDDIRDLKSERADLQIKIFAITAAQDKIKASLVDTETRLNATQAELADTKVKLTETEENLAAIKVKLTEAETKLAEATAKQEEARKELLATDEEQALLVSLREQKKSLELTIFDLNNQSRTLERTLKEKQNLVASLGEQKRSLQSNISKSDNELEKVQVGHTQLSADIEKRANQLKIFETQRKNQQKAVVSENQTPVLKVQYREQEVENKNVFFPQSAPGTQTASADDSVRYSPVRSDLETVTSTSMSTRSPATGTQTGLAVDSVSYSPVRGDLGTVTSMSTRSPAAGTQTGLAVDSADYSPVTRSDLGTVTSTSTSMSTRWPAAGAQTASADDSEQCNPAASNHLGANTGMNMSAPVAGVKADSSVDSARVASAPARVNNREGNSSLADIGFFSFGNDRTGDSRKKLGISMSTRGFGNLG